MILMIDNYDSFTYNLVQYLGELGQEIEVRRNDQITLDEIRQMKPDHIVISPGPGTPDSGGISLDILQTFAPTIPILGVCLGHQCIGQAYGAQVTRAPQQMHGKTSPVLHDGQGIFTDIPNPFQATRYHSLIIEELPDSLEITAQTADGTIMGVRHKTFPTVGVQFHPESILTEHGHQLLQNFLKLYSPSSETCQVFFN